MRDAAIRSGRAPGDHLAGAILGDGRDGRAVEHLVAAGQRDGARGQPDAPRPQRDVDGEVDAARPVGVDLGELAGAVQRVDDPDPLGGEAARVVLRLLGQDGVVGAVVRQLGGEPGLGVSVARRAEALAVERQVARAGPLAQANELAARAGGQGGRKAHVVGAVGGRDTLRMRALARHQGPPAVIRCRLLHAFVSPADAVATPGMPPARELPPGPGRRERRYHPRMPRTDSACPAGPAGT